MKFGLPDELILDIKKVFNKFNIDDVHIFGSRAKGNYKNGSDIDLAIMNNINDNELSKIIYEIDELNSPYKFDILIYNNITNKDLKEHIQRVGIKF